MFLESLLETSTQAKTRRGWATLTSFLIETAAIGVLILVPMLYTDALPSVAAFVHNTVSVPVGGGPAHDNPTEPREPQHPKAPQTEFMDGKLQAPGRIPIKTYTPTVPEAPVLRASSDGPCVPECVQGSVGTPGQQNGVITEMLRRLPTAKPQAAVTGPVPVVSNIVEGMLTRRVQPVYPRPAVITHTQGAVVLHAIIGRDGVIRQWQVASGHPLLVGAAVDAIRQWRYRPYYLNGQAVEVETEITVNFVLNR